MAKVGIVNRYDSIAWATLLKLTRGIGKAFSDSIYEKARIGLSNFGDALHQAYQTNFQGMPAAQASLTRTLMQSVLVWIDSHLIPEEHEGGWGQWIIDSSQGENAPVLTEAFKSLLVELDRLIESNQSFDRYLGQIVPLSKDIALANSAGVRIMTLGKAKGLTVRATIIGAVEEGIIPRPDSNLDEERRLLYVGMTRAKEFLFCTWARRRKGPTARSGAPRVGVMRNHSTFLINGPLESQDGLIYINHYS